MTIVQSRSHRHGLTGVGTSTYDERGNDLYETPSVATLALIDAEPLPHHIWEPACGRGAISEILKANGHTVYSSDKYDYGYGETGVDFLESDQRRVDCEAIVTNPPYRYAAEFVRRALFHAPRVVMLLRLAFLEGSRRSDIIDGGKLSHVFVFRNRIPRMHRDGYVGPTTTSSIAFAWFVWNNSNVGLPRIKRISWGKKDAIRTVQKDSETLA